MIRIQSKKCRVKTLDMHDAHIDARNIGPVFFGMTGKQSKDQQNGTIRLIISFFNSFFVALASFN